MTRNDEIHINMWVTYANLRPCLKVPQTVHVPRSFARDESDVIYVYHMASFVTMAAGSRVPLYRDDITL